LLQACLQLLCLQLGRSCRLGLRCTHSSCAQVQALLSLAQFLC